MSPLLPAVGCALPPPPPQTCARLFCELRTNSFITCQYGHSCCMCFIFLYSASSCCHEDAPSPLPAAPVTGQVTGAPRTFILSCECNTEGAEGMLRNVSPGLQLVFPLLLEMCSNRSVATLPWQWGLHCIHTNPNKHDLPGKFASETSLCYRQQYRPGWEMGTIECMVEAATSTPHLKD